MELNYFMKNYAHDLLKLTNNHYFLKLFVKMNPFINIVKVDGFNNISNNLNLTQLYKHGCCHHIIFNSKNNTKKVLFFIRINNTSNSYYVCTFTIKIFTNKYRKFLFKIFNNTKSSQQSDILKTQVMYIGNDEENENISKIFSDFFMKLRCYCSIHDEYLNNRINLYLGREFVDDMDKMNDAIHLVMFYALYHKIIGCDY
jgi:hypothetical protein